MRAELVENLINRGDPEGAAANLAPAVAVEAAKILMRLGARERRDVFCALSKRDIKKTAQVLRRLDKQDALELLCELSLRGMESEKWKLVDDALMKEIKRRSPQLVQEAHNFVYSISAGSSLGTENVSDIKGQNGLHLSVTRTRFVRFSQLRATCLTSQNGKPTRYVAGLGKDELVEATFHKGVINWNVKVADGTHSSVIAAHDDVSVLDSFTWHHFSFLIGQYDETRRGKQQFNIFIPSVGHEIVVKVSRAGYRQIKLASGSTLARYYRVDFSSQALVEVWTDEAKRPLLIQERSQGLRVVNEEVLTRHAGSFS